MRQHESNPILSMAYAGLILALAYLIFTIAQQQQRGQVLVVPQQNPISTQPQTAVIEPVQQQPGAAVSQPSGAVYIESGDGAAGGGGWVDAVQQVNPQTAVNAVQLPAADPTVVFQAACNEAANSGRRGNPKCADNRPIATPAAGR